MARKKATKKRKAAKKSVVPKALPEPMPVGKSCSSGDHLLCKISLVMAVFFLMTLWGTFASLVNAVPWWVWLALAILFGIKPMKCCCRK